MSVEGRPRRGRRRGPRPAGRGRRRSTRGSSARRPPAPGSRSPGSGAARVVSRYYVEIQTGWQTWAGTDATVHAKAYGCDDTDGEFVNLDSSVNDFEPGSFRRYGSWNWNLNGVCQLAIVKYDNGDDWQVDYANVVDGVTGAVHRCLAADGSNGYFPDTYEWKYFWCYRI